MTTDRLTGFFETRRRKGYPWVAALIELSDGQFSLTLDGERHPETWPETTKEQLFADRLERGEDAFRHPLLSVWLFGRACSEGDYRYRLAMSAHARQHHANHPLARPDQPIDLGIVPLNFII